jgi:hypothetical protein
MKEHVELLTEQGLPVPPSNPSPVVTIHNEKKDDASAAAAPTQGTS